MIELFPAGLNADMNVILSKANLGRSKISPKPAVFIWSALPFVGLKIPFIKPSVGHIQPFIGTAGFTIHELMLVLAITAVLATIAVPSMQSFVLNNRLTTQANDFLADLSLARTEAVKRGINVGVCASSSSTACTTDSLEAGWIVFLDNDENDAWSAGDEVLRIHPDVGANTFGDGNAAADLVLFMKPLGMLKSGDGTYTLCDGGLGKGREITVQLTTGRAAVKKLDNC